MSINSIFLLTLTILLRTVSGGIVFSQDLPDRSEPPRLVNDFAMLLDAEEISILERKLVAFNDSTSTQIAIVIVPTLLGYDRSDYAQRLAEKWGIGQKGLDNGVLILVKPKTGDSNGEAFIAQGYGLEGAIPDITCGEIVDYEILPSFRSGNYFTGLDDATNTLMSLASGEFPAEEYGQSANKNAGKDGSVMIFIIVAIIIIVLIFRKSGGSNNKNISSSGLPFWLLLGMMNSGRGSHSGSWGGFSGGRGSGGGGAGGSW